MKSQILRFIKTELLSGIDVSIQPDDDLLTTEIIDSMGVMRLISFVEQTFELTIPPEDVTIENFISINAIKRYLALKLGARGSESC